mmetsp:Transcript_30186/g.89589  ORF Transcript_30186/g.89589 Transcript_30186/m.89589 type:complete len:307 (+) Transcript_30186:994-1914(+)
MVWRMAAHARCQGREIAPLSLHQRPPPGLAFPPLLNLFSSPASTGRSGHRLLLRCGAVVPYLHHRRCERLCFVVLALAQRAACIAASLRRHKDHAAARRARNCVRRYHDDASAGHLHRDQWDRAAIGPDCDRHAARAEQRRRDRAGRQQVTRLGRPSAQRCRRKSQRHGRWRDAGGMRRRHRGDAGWLRWRGRRTPHTVLARKRRKHRLRGARQRSPGRRAWTAVAVTGAALVVVVVVLVLQQHVQAVQVLLLLLLRVPMLWVPVLLLVMLAKARRLVLCIILLLQPVLLLKLVVQLVVVLLLQQC